MISLILLGFVILFLLVLFYFVPIGLWIQGVVSVGLGKISIIDLIRMRLRKIPPRLITDGVINCHKAGLT
ncbi:MAG: flotillin-like FloA family protein, partial [Candidatus Marinimicrobia bacterium]|nr:flotillin-like FloA family protein [Candidatus Neomarinimicrobiota bacterium]